MIQSQLIRPGGAAAGLSSFAGETPTVRNVVSLFDLSTQEIETIFRISDDLKAKLRKNIREPLLPGRVMALLFEKPSLRTRVSFETGMAHLGGSTMFLGADTGWGSRESPEDFARVLSQYVDVIVCRAKSHSRVEELAHCATCSVINGLTDFCHPCQALADLFTLREIHGKLKGRKLAYVGDANNVARSLAVGCAKLGVQMAFASPLGYELSQDFVSQVKQAAPDFQLTMTHDAAEAVGDADCVYTDVWASMGQEAERQERIRVFQPYQVNAQLMAHAPDRAVFMHCLPARRGEEVIDEVLDGDQSVVVQQAANRLHAQKGLLAWLLGGREC